MEKYIWLGLVPLGIIGVALNVGCQINVQFSFGHTFCAVFSLFAALMGFVKYIRLKNQESNS